MKNEVVQLSKNFRNIELKNGNPPDVDLVTGFLLLLSPPEVGLLRRALAGVPGFPFTICGRDGGPFSLFNDLKKNII